MSQFTISVSLPFNSKGELAREEKTLGKLARDLENGGLRKKRGADFEISDSDDDAQQRRQRKQREFAKMRKALLENENVGKIAEDPKKSAFLKAIEDREDDDDLDFLGQPADDSFRIEPETQEEQESQSQQPEPAKQPEPESNRQRRPLQPSNADTTNMRPPAHSRRTPAPQKPSSIAEIRQSVSFLIEEPGAMVPASDPSSASEDEDEVSNPLHPRDENARAHPHRTTSNPIIDRLSLKREQSSSASALANTSHLAFHAPTSSSSNGTNAFFPSLLHRASTSNLSNMTDANGISHHAATERAAGGGEKGDFVRRGAGKKSSVNFAAREGAKGKVVEEVERRRREERERRARQRQREGGVGSLSRGNTWDG